MSQTIPSYEPPVACGLPFRDAKAQLERWHTFDGEYALEAQRSAARLTVHYVRTDATVRRLHELVAVERACCAFVDWRIDDSGADLRLIVTGTPFKLDALGRPFH